VGGAAVHGARAQDVVISVDADAVFNAVYGLGVAKSDLWAAGFVHWTHDFTADPETFPSAKAVLIGVFSSVDVASEIFRLTRSWLPSSARALPQGVTIGDDAFMNYLDAGEHSSGWVAFRRRNVLVTVCKEASRDAAIARAQQIDQIILTNNEIAPKGAFSTAPAITVNEPALSADWETRQEHPIVRGPLVARFAASGFGDRPPIVCAFNPPHTDAFATSADGRTLSIPVRGFTPRDLGVTQDTNVASYEIVAGDPRTNRVARGPGRLWVRAVPPPPPPPGGGQ